MLSAIILQPGGWGKAPGKIRDIYIHDVSIDNMNNPLMIVLNEGNTGDNILVERMKATRISQAAVSIESWKGGTFGNVTFRDISISSTFSRTIFCTLRAYQPQQGKRRESAGG